MSKVLKHIVYEVENPLRLMDYQIPFVRKNDRLTNEVENIRPEPYKEEATQLIEEALSKARDIIKHSKDEAVEIILKTQEEKHEIEKKAFHDGYENGYKRGIEVARKEQETIWNKYIKELNQTRLEIVNENNIFKEYLEKECMKLSLKVAEKILGKKIEEDGNYLLELIKKGMGKIGNEKNVLIRVSEDDYERVNEIISGYKNNTQTITLTKDPFLCDGDCILEGPYFEVDASIRTQLENISSTLKELEVIDDE
ncbi:MAG: FliH/SctL family protein [Tepidanaerobacteraceae bacterium]|nr:FliH/SctL family protein [Tepidanaerobacteraceae bacterium]